MNALQRLARTISLALGTKQVDTENSDAFMEHLRVGSDKQPPGGGPGTALATVSREAGGLGVTNGPISEFEEMPVVIRMPQQPRDLPIVTVDDWSSVQAIRAALTDLSNGRFRLAARMLDAMLGDSHIASKLDDRLSSVFGAPFTMQPPEGDTGTEGEEGAEAEGEPDPATMTMCEEAVEAWKHMTMDRGEYLVARDGIMLGAGLGEIVVDLQPSGEWALRIKHWSMQNVWWNWASRSYWLSTMRTTEELRPDGHGGFVSTWQDELGQQRISRWVLLTPYGYSRGWVNARLKACAIPWILRTWAYRDWGRHSELLGIPPRKVKMPQEWPDEEKRRALAEVVAMASESIIRCPQKNDGTGFDVELMELKGTNGDDVFAGLIEKAESSITVALVGQTLTTQNDQQGGSRALGEVHERVAARITKGDAAILSAAFRAGVMKPWAEFNYGSPDLAPIPTWAVDPPTDLKAKGDGLSAFAGGLSALKLSGIPVDRKKMVAEAGIPLEEGAEFEDPTPPPSPFGGKPGAKPGEEEEEEPEGKVAASIVQLARKRKAGIDGQAYVDRVADVARETAAQILAADVRKIRALINKAESFDALKLALREHYKGMNPTELGYLTQKVMVLADLAGRLAALKEGR